MSLNEILNDWKEYDDKKRKSGLDPNYFLWDESWEIHYLKSKIKNSYPQYHDLAIFEAIEACCKTKIVLRIDFVSLVIDHLRLHKQLSN